MRKYLIFLFIPLLWQCAKQDQADACVETGLRDASIACDSIYAPVCGCDGETYRNACVAKFGAGLSRFSPGACGCSYPFTGVVRNYSGLDGCGLMIDLPNGERLEPVKLPAGFHLRAGMQLELNYTALTNVASTCMAGILANITCVQELGCKPLYQATLFEDSVDLYFRDELRIMQAAVIEDCLEVEFQYAGGCGQHEFELMLEPIFCGTPPIGSLQLSLRHRALNESCKAIISQALSFDLQPLQAYTDSSSTPFVLKELSGRYHEDFLYHY